MNKTAPLSLCPACTSKKRGGEEILKRRKRKEEKSEGKHQGRWEGGVHKKKKTKMWKGKKR